MDTLVCKTKDDVLKAIKSNRKFVLAPTLTQLVLRDGMLYCAFSELLSLLLMYIFRFEGIGDSGACALSDSLKSNSTLTTLSLTSNSIGDSGALALIYSLKLNTTLTTLYLRYTSISKPLMTQIDGKLAKNKGLFPLLHFLCSCSQPADPNSTKRHEITTSRKNMDVDSKQEFLEQQILKECKIKDFEIISKLGGGRNGMVVSVKCTHKQHPNPDKLYALKTVFNYLGATTKPLLRAFASEYTRLSTLKPHKNIIR